MTSDHQQRLLIAQDRVERQRALIALLEARGSDTAEAKSLLSGLQYSLKLLKRRHGDRWVQDAQ
jgi:hypothetical protein